VSLGRKADRLPGNRLSRSTDVGSPAGVQVAADRGLEREFARIEKSYLVPVEQLYRPIPNMPWLTTTENWKLL
jgi:hypothetical protein